MPAAVICFETFRAKRQRERVHRSADASPTLPFLRSFRPALPEREVSHRRVMLAHFDRVRKEGELGSDGSDLES
jgi:hypothetical protein